MGFVATVGSTPQECYPALPNPSIPRLSTAATLPGFLAPEVNGDTEKPRQDGI